MESQLNEGVRNLDLRVGDFGPGAKGERFIFVHDSCDTTVTVRNGLN